MVLLRSDRALLQQFRAGERSALERVYWHYVDLVTEVLRRGVVFANGGRVQGCSAADLSDLVQEAFTRAFAEKARLAYDGLRDYRPYLLTVCRNLLVDWTRKRGRELPNEEKLATELEGLDPETTSCGVEEWADPATMGKVEQYVASLTPPLSVLYEQRYVRGVSQSEAAQALGIGRQSVRTLEKRLREGLVAALDSSD